MLPCNCHFCGRKGQTDRRLVEVIPDPRPGGITMLKYGQVCVQCIGKCPALPPAKRLDEKPA